MGLILDAARSRWFNRADGPRDRQALERDERRLPTASAGAGFGVTRGGRQNEDVARLAAAVAIALGAVGLKVIIVGVLGGELGYLSYLGRRRARGLDRRLPRRRDRDDHLCVAQTLLFSRAASDRA